MKTKQRKKNKGKTGKEHKTEEECHRCETREEKIENASEPASACDILSARTNVCART